MSSGHRYGVTVSPLSFEPVGLENAPTVAPLGVVQTSHREGDSSTTGSNYVVDTGAQMSIISTTTATALGFNLSRPDSTLPVSGVGGVMLAPVFTVDRLSMTSQEGVELVWSDVQVLALNIDPSIDGVIGSDLLNSSSGQSGELNLDSLLLPSSGAIEKVLFDFRNLDNVGGTGTLFFDLNSSIDVVQMGPSVLQAGDANADLQFDQLDIVQVLQRGRYLTGQPATWGDGDWNGAPGGAPNRPPIGDGVFDQRDIVASLGNDLFKKGPYDAIKPQGNAGDMQTSVGYDPGTGEVFVDAPGGVELTSINIDSASGIFTGAAALNLGGSFDNDSDTNIFKATFGSRFASLSFGIVAQPGLSEEFLLNDLYVIGSLSGGGDLGQVDLIYVPEPTSLALLLLGVIGVAWSLRQRLMR
jgi:hypothetical protein